LQNLIEIVTVDPARSEGARGAIPPAPAAEISGEENAEGPVRIAFQWFRLVLHSHVNLAELGIGDSRHFEPLSFWSAFYGIMSSQKWQAANRGVIVSDFSEASTVLSSGPAKKVVSDTQK
jgi:hypothetical protein